MLIRLLSKIAFCAGLVATAFVAAPASAATDKAGGTKMSVTRPVKQPSVIFNQDYVEGLYTNINVKKPMEVFKVVFGALKKSVTIYPTENYYYFQFRAGGKTYWGNLRLDAVDRDKGILHLGYFKFDDYGRYRESNNHYKKLNAKAGVVVKKVSRFVYTVTYKGRTVTFNLYDIGWKPPVKTGMRPSEKYVGPVFDESGTRFHLIFDTETKHLMYILNEDGPIAERWERINKAVLVGERTGFAYFVDHKYKRKILIGVHAVNAQKKQLF